MNNLLTKLPPEIGSLSSLTRLWINNNKLAILPPEIGNLISLHWLWLSNNQLTSVPPEIGSLTSLTWLQLGYNQLTGFPDEFWNLSALTNLELNSNQLTSIPPEIGRLTALRVLDLSGNLLTSLPIEIIQLNLTITLGGNRICYLPDAIDNWIEEPSGFGAVTHWKESQTIDGTQFCEVDIVNIELLSKDDNKIFIDYTPFRGQVTFYFDNRHSNNSLIIYNTSGKQVKAFEGASEYVTWNTQGQSRGVYFIKVKVNGEQLVKKILLE